MGGGGGWMRGAGRRQEGEGEERREEGGEVRTLSLSTSIFSSPPADSNQITTKEKENV